MRRLRALFNRQLGYIPADEEQRLAVLQVLEAQSAREILGIDDARLTTVLPPAHGTPPPEQPGSDNAIALLEAGHLSTEHAPSQPAVRALAEADVMEAFVTKAVQVHPTSNSHPDALVAFRWTAHAFQEVHLNWRSNNRPATSEAASTSSNSAATTETTDNAIEDPVDVRSTDHQRTEEQRAEEPNVRECSTDADEALRLFAEAVSFVNDRLTLQLPDESAQDLDQNRRAEMVNSLLRALHILHLRDPLARPSEEEFETRRSMLDSVLYSTLTTHWLLRTMLRCFGSSARRQHTEHFFNSMMAALGGIAFQGVCRINRMLSAEPGQPLQDQSSFPVIAMLYVQCPLCRQPACTQRVIKNVCAGEGLPNCCVCTEARSSVCLPCGHLCLCEACFSRLPRTTEA